MKRLIKFGVSLLSALLLSLPLGAQMVTASFDGTPLPDVIAKLKEQTGCSVISSDKIDLESYTVTASLNKTPLSEALSRFSRPRCRQNSRAMSLPFLLQEQARMARLPAN